MSIKRFANPKHFLCLVESLLPWLVGLIVLFLGIGLYLSFTSPPDYRQGELVRIVYVHVPMAWLSMFCYTVIAVSALGTLVWQHPLAAVSAKAAAPIGAVFSALTLITGSIWAKPAWGVFWIWDARLTSMLVLFFLYLGLIALAQAIEEPRHASRAVAILALVGFINVPIIKFSVNWWSTIHQPASVMRWNGPALHSSMLTPLLVMAIGFSLMFIVLHMMIMRNEILRIRTHSMRLMQADSAGVS